MRTALQRAMASSRSLVVLLLAACLCATVSAGSINGTKLNCSFGAWSDVAVQHCENEIYVLVTFMNWNHPSIDRNLESWDTLCLKLVRVTLSQTFLIPEKWHRLHAALLESAVMVLVGAGFLLKGEVI
jgi:hypothetical protein